MDLAWQFEIGCAGRDNGQTGAQRSIIEPSVKDGGAQSLWGDAVAVGFWDALGKAVEA